MNTAWRIVMMLEREETYVEIEETGDQRYYAAVHQLPGDDKEYRVEFFDGQPVTVQWKGVRMNMNGDMF